MGYTVDIDTGGTFTDGFFTLGERFETVKVDTTPHDLTVCFMECIKEGAKKFGLKESRELLRETDVVRFSTTIGTNTLLEGSGTKLGLIVTGGFEDKVFEETNGNAAFNSIIVKDRVSGIQEEISADGVEVTPVDEKELVEVVKRLLEKGARTIVVSLTRSDVNPIHEQKIKGLLAQHYPKHYLGSVPLLLASQISIRPQPRLRTNTALVNAYLHHGLARSLYKADENLRQHNYARPLLIVHSTGGVARVSKTTAVQTYNSGPVAGLYGSVAMARLYKLENIVTLDVGGTSSDVGLIYRGNFETEYPSKIEGIPVDFPMVSMSVVAAGGGSIARLNESRKGLVVGPQSAGAMPGPACYALGGGEPTLTDSYLALGYLDPDYFMGGLRPLHKDLALEAIENDIASPLEMNVETTALEIKRFLARKVATGVERLLLDKGLRPENVALFAFGGGGGCLCSYVATLVGIPRTYLFPHSAVFCAYGSSMMDVLHTYEHSKKILLRSRSGKYLANLDEYNQIIAKLQRRSFRDMRGEGFTPSDIGFALELELNVGATSPVIIEHPGLFLNKVKDVQSLCDRLKGTVPESTDIAIEIFRLKAFCMTPHYAFKAFSSSGDNPRKSLKGTRDIYWGEGFVKTKVYNRHLLESGNIVMGPAVIEAQDTTCIVPSGKKYKVDQYLNGIIEEV